jgi:NRPS condensation-like uncharacterized protein
LRRVPRCISLLSVSRSFVPAERMAERFDKAYTLNFTSIARVTGALSEAALLRALRCLERRHPLLRARIAREGGELRYVYDEAGEIPLRIEQATPDALLARAALTLRPCAWSDAGPHAELIWLRHDAERSSLLLRQHHVVSDGSSGIVLMRDLLRFVAEGDPARVTPIPSPGQDAFFPESFAALRAATLEKLKQKPVPGPEVLRLSRFEPGEVAEARSAKIRRLQLDVDESEALALRARRAGATVHGALMAAIARAIAQETGRTALQRIVHPVDLRRYLRELEPGGTPIGEAVGYYVSAVTTEHSVDADASLDSLAHAITTGVRAAKAASEPLIAAPIRGPALVERTRAMDIAAFRELAEQKLFTNTFGISNLGPLERLGVEPQVGALEIEDVFFVAASSVMNQFGGTAVGFRGRVGLQLNCVEPLVPEGVLDAVTQRVGELLRGYARGE